MPPGDRSPRLCLVISYSLWTALQGRADFELLGERTGFSFAAVESNGSRLFIAVRSSSVTYPHTLNYPALAWELHQAGCTHVLSAGVAGALDRDTPVPSLLIPVQFIDLHRTAPVNTPHHEDSLYKDFSVPYCPFLRSQAQAFLARRSEWPVSKAGNYVGVDGPRYETA
ncbi:MAG TPA: hypothetical protein VG672_02210, partial [Bryobacteraceae bacterium]|nr:hypothetical protein [Bryobacteraceae bacterium]